MRVFTLPNVITLIRIIIIPIFVTALIYKRYHYALILFIICAVSDMLDGLLARITNQKTQLGALLDPIADKLLLITSFILFSLYGWIPKWLTVTVISRDMIVTLGWILLYLIHNMTHVKPTFTGKTAIASQLLLIAYTLLSITVMGIPPSKNWMAWTVATLTIISGLHYIYRGLTQANEK